MLGEMWQFRGRYKILHITWFAFFLSFVVWFNFAPLATTVGADLGLTKEQVGTIAICNVALTVPARIIIGMLLDKFGPRLTFSLLLMYASIPCIMFASAQNFSQLVISRLLMGIVGAGFVIGIRMVAEWFPPKEIGLAEGIYGGWGNFGSAFSAFTMALFAGWLSFGAPGSGLNWRAAIAGTGIFAALYGIFYLFNAKDTPPGKAYRRPKSARGLEVTTKKDFWFLLLMNVPLSAVLGLVAWRLMKLGLYGTGTMYVIWLVLLGLYLFQAYNCWAVNKDLMTGKKRYPAEDRYNFSQVAILELTYVVNFGSELAVVSMLPAFFEGTFSLSPATAGMIASSYAFMNLVARPGGGLISDKLGSRKLTMGVLTGCMGIAYLLFSQVNSGWFLPAAVALVMCCSFFVQAGEGSTFSIVPLVKKRVTGQVAGNVGAYGNVGAVLYLNIFSLLPGWLGGGADPSPAIEAATDARFFQIMGVAALIVSALCFVVLKEPKGSFADAHHDEEKTIPNTSAVLDTEGVTENV